MIGGFSISIDLNMYTKPIVVGVTYIRFDNSVYTVDDTSITWDQEVL